MSQEDANATKVTPTHGRAYGQWRPAFLAMLRNSANVRLSCHEAGINRKTAYQHRDEDPAFREQWDEALQDACDLLEATARVMALQGDADLIKFLLRAHRREVYGDQVKVDITTTIKEEAKRVADETGVPLDEVIRRMSTIMAGATGGR